jgi:hypothetical protein
MEYMVNRDFFIIQPKRPLADWVNDYDESSIDPEIIMANKTIYMVEELEYNSEKHVLKLIKKYFKEIFYEQLFGWLTDESYFPDFTSFKLFTEWFDYQYVEIGYDLLDGDIEKEEL